MPRAAARKRGAGDVAARALLGVTSLHPGLNTKIFQNLNRSAQSGE
jgi:hypothetical protein